MNPTPGSVSSVVGDLTGSNLKLETNVIADSDLSTVKMGFPAKRSSTIDYATFTLGDAIIDTFTTDLELPFSKALDSQWGRTIKAVFNENLRQQFTVLINRAAMMENIDPAVIKNPINEKNEGFLKLGKKYDGVDHFEASGKDKVKFGLYHSKAKNTYGFFLRLE